MNQHTMQLDNVLPSGEQEWFCPTCGRRFLLQVPPNYKKTILVAGDRSAKHNGVSLQELDLAFAALRQESAIPTQPVLNAEDRNPATTPASDILQKMLKEKGLDHLL